MLGGGGIWIGAVTGGGGGGTPGGSSTQLQYNNSGAFGGLPTTTFASSLLTIGDPLKLSSQTNLDIQTSAISGTGAVIPAPVKPVIRLTGTVTTVAGIDNTGVLNGTTVEIQNNTGHTVTLFDQNAGQGTAAQRIITNYAVNPYPLLTGSSITAQYDTSVSRWKLINIPFGIITPGTQTFGGDKTFFDQITFTAGHVIFNDQVDVNNIFNFNTSFGYTNTVTGTMSHFVGDIDIRSPHLYATTSMGVGTTTPTVPLDVIGDTKVEGNFGAGFDPTLPSILSHTFQVAGGSSIAAPTSSSGSITYYPPPLAPTLPVISATYSQQLYDSASLTSIQNGGSSGYTANGATMNYFVAGYKVVNGKTLYSHGLTTSVFTDDNSGLPYGVDLAWAAITGATGYVIFVSGGVHVGTEAVDVGNVLSYTDTDSGYTAIAYPPVDLGLFYNAAGNTNDYNIFDYQVAAALNLYSVTGLAATLTDNNSSEHSPASGSAVANMGGGSYPSSSTLTHQYQVWSQYSDGGYSSTDFTASVSASNITVADPTGFSAVQDNGSSGYTANGYSFIFTAVSYQIIGGRYIFSPGVTTNFTDDSSTAPYGIQLSWTPAAAATGTLLFIQNGPNSYNYYSVDAGVASVSFLDTNSAWTLSNPFPMNSQPDPTWTGAPTQNDGETGYGPSDGSYSFTYRISAYYSTPFGRIYTVDTSTNGFTDLNDASPDFGIDLSWNPLTSANGIAAAGYYISVVGTSSGPNHPVEVAQDVGGATSLNDQNTNWNTIAYPPPNPGAFLYTYQVDLNWAAVTGAASYLVLKAGGDSGWTYNFYVNPGTNSFIDTDDSVWTSYAGANPPTPVESPITYDVHLAWTAAAGGPTYRALHQYNGGGYTQGYDTASTSFIDGNGSFSWTGTVDVTNVLYHATGATQSCDAYTFDSSIGVYCLTPAGTSVTDNNSGDYYTVDWDVSNQPTGADNIKFIINTIHGELTPYGSNPFVDTSQAYNSNTTVTPTSTTSPFYSNSTGDVVVNTLTATTNIVTPQIGTTGLISIGSGASAGTNGVAIGPGAFSTGTNGVCIGNTSSAGANGVGIGLNAGASGAGLAIGHLANALGADSIAIGANTQSLPSSIAIGDRTNTTTAGPCMAIGTLCTASNIRAIAIGYSCTASAQNGLAIGRSAITGGGSNGISIGFNATSSTTNPSGIAIGNSASTDSGIAIGTSASTTGSGGIAIGFGVTNTVTGTAEIGPANNAKIHIDATGQLGIKNTAPASVLDVTGDIRTPGTSGNTYRWTANTTAPSTTATPTFTSYYGGNTKALGDPVDWVLININGTNRKIPVY